MSVVDDFIKGFAGGSEKLGKYEAAAVRKFGTPVSEGARSVLEALRYCDNLLTKLALIK